MVLSARSHDSGPTGFFFFRNSCISASPQGAYGHSDAVWALLSDGHCLSSVPEILVCKVEQIVHPRVSEERQ